MAGKHYCAASGPVAKHVEARGFISGTILSHGLQLLSRRYSVSAVPRRSSEHLETARFPLSPFLALSRLCGSVRRGIFAGSLQDLRVSAVMSAQVSLGEEL